MILESHDGPLRAVISEVPGLRLWISEHAVAAVSVHEAGWESLSVSSPVDGLITVIMKARLGQAAGYWHPSSGNERTLVPDWAGMGTTSAVSSAPIGVLYDSRGDTVFGFASSAVAAICSLRWGVAEEDGTFVIAITMPMRPGETVRLRLGSGGEFGSVVKVLGEWMSGSVGRGALAIPTKARRPVYSTWYAYHNELDEERIEGEAARATELGFGSVFLDFGWQLLGDSRYFDGCGDWFPDPTAFPDLADFVHRIKRRGLDVVLWIAPLMLGARSAASAEWAPFAPHYSNDLRVRILDPRFPEVRDHIVETCVRLMRDYGIDGLKIDFVDIAMEYAQSPSTGDIDDVSQAMLAVFSRIRDEFELNGWDQAYIEFRQPYVSPALAPFGNIVRAGDCPGDAVANRTAIVDARLLANRQLVHSDMVMWGADATPETVAWHLYNTLFAVPQLSVRLGEQTAEHAAVIAAFLALWSRIEDVSARAPIRPGASHARYPVVRADDGDGRVVIVVYESTTVVLDNGDRDVTIVNATAGRIAVAQAHGGRCRATIRVHDHFGRERVSGVVHLAETLEELPIPSLGWASLAVEVIDGHASGIRSDYQN